MFISPEAVLTSPNICYSHLFTKRIWWHLLLKPKEVGGKHSDESDVKNQVADVIICILEIIAVFPKFKDMLNGNKMIYEKLGKMSAHCGSFEMHNTETVHSLERLGASLLILKLIRWR